MLHDDRPLKAVIPGGSSTPVLRPDDLVDAPDEKHPLHAWHGKSHIDVPMGVDTYARARHHARHVLRDRDGQLGQHGRCRAQPDALLRARVVRAVHAVPRRHRLAARRARTSLCDGQAASAEDVDLLVDIANNMMGNTICAFADGTAMPMLGFVQKFRDEFIEAGKRRRRAPARSARARAAAGRGGAA